VSPVHAACIAAILRFITAIFADISATTSARESSVRGRAPEDAGEAAAEDTVDTAEEEGYGSGGVGGKLDCGSGGSGGEPDIADTRLIGFLILPATLRSLYGCEGGGAGRVPRCRRLGAVARL